jgi:membrane-associated phospholipid phosphatase
VTSARLGRHTAGRAALVGVLLIAFTLVLVVVELRWGPVHRLDRRVATSLHRTEVAHPTQADWWRWVSRVLHPDVLRITAVIAAVTFWVRRQRSAALLVLVAMAGAAALETTTKALVGRDRPAFADPVAHAPGASFPSGHAMTSIVAFGLVVLLVPAGRRATAITVGVCAVGLVGFSRVALGVHYVSDVVAGWLLGAAWLVVADWLVSRRSAPSAARPGPDRPRGRSAC